MYLRVEKKTQLPSNLILSYILSYVSPQEEFSVIFVTSFRVERSSDQIIKPINLDALTKWVGKFPDDVVKDMPNIAPMLSVFGYDPYGNPPKYGDPDKTVSEKTYELHQKADIWDSHVQKLINASNKTGGRRLKSVDQNSPEERTNIKAG